ncbi:magnesium transporter [Shewanella inventionis]|uniref:Magnesium transporter n=1 Tax=Shewanella inventionis TaxID=1738770 RepID=A0ABQ1IQ49_9GAMM|nr:magnesium transporter [Shewanella inventionis]MCL1157729.1 magnesium transporter [Shewanella inventionis]GGB48066.1 magnesium transporter [Shewanella inventionis]
MNDLKNELNSDDEIESSSSPQADVSQVVLQLTEAEGEEQAEVFSEILIDAEPGTIALLLESLPLDERYERWQQVDVEERVDVLNLMRADPRLGILKKMPDEELDLLFSQLSPEDLIEWSDSLPDNITDRALAQMGERQRKHFELYDQYTENEIGRYADHQMLALNPSSTVAQGQRFFRRIDLDCNDHLFLVDNNDKYLGTVRRYDVFKTVDTDTPLQALKWDDSRVISADSSLIEAAEAIEHSRELELPVVDEDGILIGRMTLRTATALVREHYEAQLMATAGMDEDDDLFAPIVVGAKRRAVWLGINLLTAFLASATIGMFENVLSQVVALAVLMPIVASMGGIAGSQSLTLMIRGMAMGQITAGNVMSLMKNELGIGALNGTLWAIVIGIIAGWWFDDTVMGVVIACAILINMAVAAIAGVMVPMILQRFNQDAALSGSVILTTVTDVVGFFTFLGLASILYL